MSELLTATQGSVVLAPEQAQKLGAFQDYLVRHAHAALESSSFAERNSEMATAVADEASILAADSIRQSGATVDALGLRNAFYAATVEAGQAFSAAFNERGKALPGNLLAYVTAMNATGDIALAHLPDALRAAGVRDIEDPRVLLNAISFDDVVRLTASQLGADSVSMDLRPEAVQAALHETLPADNYFADLIDALPLSDRAPLAPEAERALDIAVRLANATWKVGEVHRAAQEGNDRRIDPAQREAFNPYDVSKHEQYARLIQEGRAPEEAVLRVAFEVWKNVILLRTPRYKGT